MSSNPFKSFANIFKPGDDVDEEDDYTPDEMYDEEPRRRRGQRGQGSYDDEDEDDYDEDEPRKPKASVFGRPSQPQGRDRDQQQSHPDVKPSSLVDAGQEVRVFKPTNLVEARKVTDTLLSEQSAILNLEGLDIAMAQRIIDFVGGSNYAIHGHFTRISNYIFLFTPKDVNIAGDIVEGAENSEVQNAGGRPAAAQAPAQNLQYY
ncbi:MAG: cell division protein SepF [Lachnospiraceae bacterium]|jgi:cell division inhibitor SepF|nr:cell division protein SepF [Lachnospiraceae bacterium]